jgi:hypothetical protein
VQFDILAQQYETNETFIPNHLMSKVLKHNQNDISYRVVNFDDKTIEEKNGEQEGKLDIAVGLEMKLTPIEEERSGLVLFQDSKRINPFDKWKHTIESYQRILLVLKIELEKFRTIWEIMHYNYDKIISNDATNTFSDFKSYEYLYFFIYSQGKGYLATMERFTEDSCEEAKLVILNEFDAANKSWEVELKIPEKFTNFHKCPLLISSSSDPGMKLLRALVDGIAHKFNATFGIIEGAKTFAVNVLYKQSDEALMDFEYFPISILPNKMHVYTHQ